MIPKNIHIIWIGGKSFPEVCSRYFAQWKFLHPDWSVKLWGNEEVSAAYPEAYRLLSGADEASISDLLRYKILYDFGGVYADADVEPLKPFTPLLPLGGFLIGRRRKGVCGNTFLAEKGNGVCSEAMAYWPKVKRGGPLCDHLLSKFSGELVQLPEAYFQADVPTEESYSSHWSHPLGSWTHKEIPLKRR
jgi:hypothetical protein